MFINNRTGITTQGWILENALKTTVRWEGVYNSTQTENF